MGTAKTPKNETLLARREVNDFRALRFDVVTYGKRALFRVGFEGRNKGSKIWHDLGAYVVLDLEDINWFRKELARAEQILATLSKP